MELTEREVFMEEHSADSKDWCGLSRNLIGLRSATVEPKDKRGTEGASGNTLHRNTNRDNWLTTVVTYIGSL